jgi:hypothetical protein
MFDALAMFFFMMKSFPLAWSGVIKWWVGFPRKVTESTYSPAAGRFRTKKVPLSPPADESLPVHFCRCGGKVAGCQEMYARI